MFTKRDRNDVRLIRHARVRKKISGTPDMPRLCVFRSNQFIYAQLIDDTQGATLAQASSMEPSLKDELSGKKKVEQSKMVGKLIAQRALDKGISNVVFDRGGYVYAGRVASLAEGAREAGLKF